MTNQTIDLARVDPFTLRFVEPELEASFQAEEGQAGLPGYRMITAAASSLWLVAAPLIPFGTNISPSASWIVGGVMALVALGCFALAPWARTMNRQHGLASALTAANGAAILVLGLIGSTVQGFAVGGIMLLYMFAFVSRTRFVFALVRSVFVAAAFGLVMANHDGSASLIMDAYFLAGASVANLLGLRLIERNRRRVWHQYRVIEEQRASIEVERSESERLLLNVLPASISQRLRRGEYPIADDFSSVTVLFADIVGFTAMTSKMGADQVIEMLNGLFTMFDGFVADRGLEKIKTVGDAYMVVGGLPDPLPDHAIRVVDLAMAMLECTGRSEHFPGLTLRIGIHSGPVAGGVIGTHKFSYDVWGSTVNLASRLESNGVPGRIHVSSETMNLTAGRFQFEPRGQVELRGLGSRTTYLLAEPNPRLAGTTRGATTPV